MRMILRRYKWRRDKLVHFCANACAIGSKSPSMILVMLCHFLPMRWSVMRSLGKLYVRIFSLRSPEPICCLRSAVSDPVASRRAISCSFARSTSIAVSRLPCWVRSVRAEMTMPVGLCKMRTADSTLLTFCPPGPPLREKVTSRS